MTAIKIGYARVSTDGQDLTVQRQALAALGVQPDRIYVDHGVTGTHRQRPGLREALAACRPGATLVVTTFVARAQERGEGLNGVVQPGPEIFRTELDEFPPTASSRTHCTSPLPRPSTASRSRKAYGGGAAGRRTRAPCAWRRSRPESGS